MPLEPTASPVATAADTRRLGRITALLVSLIVLLSLSACAEGNARDAREGQEVDAERTSVVRDLQATNSARILAGTPPPTEPAD